MQEIVIYTDGAAKGNPGPGGFGVVMMYGPHRKELFGGYRMTTNNRMELLAAIVGLEALTKPGLSVVVYSDSKYVVDAVEKRWVFSWETKNYAGKANSDLWKRFLVVYRKHKVRLQWVKGHADNVENNRCDELAVMASSSNSLFVDYGYENMPR